jgi:Tir chaperone protein (CesT) family
MRTDDVYLAVLREFVALSGADASALELGSEVSFEFDGMLAFIFMHPLHESVVIDVEILQLREPLAEPVNLERMVLLHQLNSITRFTHGAQACLSVDNMLMLSQSLPVEGLTGQGLADLMGRLLDSAVNLRAAWSDLRSLIAKAGQPVQTDRAKSMPLDAVQFA